MVTIGAALYSLLMALTDAQRDLLLEVHDAHEGTFGGGVLVGAAAERSQTVNELVVAGLIERHPPRAPVLLIPTGLGRERAEEIRRRQKAARKGAHKRKRAL